MLISSQWMALSSLVILLAACSSFPMHLTLRAAHSLNPDVQQQSLPVQVRVYQLSRQREFAGATFRELWKNDHAVLAKSLIEREQYVVRPGEIIDLKIPYKSDARYLAAIAIFRKPRHKDWRAIRTMPRATVRMFHHFNLSLNGSRIRFTDMAGA